jgi:anaerobic ribonucleoside-triphosphate reductase
MIMINYSDIKPSDIDFNYINDNIIFYNGKTSHLINSSIVKVKESKNPDLSENKVILDKILINLYAIALESNQNDNKFFDILETKLNCIFDLFKYKQLFVKKKLDHIKMWRYLISELIGNYDQVLNECAVRAISFYGLNEAVKTHCGIELDKLDKSEQFGIRTVSLLNKLIKERNTTTNEVYVLSQPLNESLKNVFYNGSVLTNAEFYHNASDIIRKDSRLPLHKQISLFKKFERYLEGGSLFKCGPFSKLESQEKYADILFKSELNAFLY